ncbi:MAG TPA: CapA family protein [Burkholderiales bacterium]|nr:CapA family protein [Burkholderiales bacterium]
MSEVVILGCGDVGPIDQPLERYSELVRPVLADADIRFAQVERVYSERGALQLASGGAHSRLKPHMASVFSDCGFNVVSLASNHAMDWGADAMLDTIAVLRDRGMQVIGAGRNLEDARRPATVEIKGTRVAFLAYCSILNNAYWATNDKPGIAPLRVHTYYEPFDYQPGIPPKVVTVPFEEDLSALLADVRAAKETADVVVLSFHWGIHFIPALVADYQPLVAKAAFDAGADLILGHHAHTPKAIGVHRGKVCFYSLSNFIMSSVEKTPEKAKAFEQQYGVTLDRDYPKLAYGADAKRSLIAKARVSNKGVSKVSFLPVIIDTKLRPEPLQRSDPRFDEMVQFMERVSTDFDHRFVADANEVIVTGAAA